MIPDIADLMIELSKEKQTGSPVRDLYTVYQDLAREIGNRMNQLNKEARDAR